MTTDSEQSGNSPAGTGEARSLFFHFFFYCLRLWIFFTIYWLCRHALSNQNYSFHYKKFWLILIPNLIWCGIVTKLNETLRARGANSHFPSPCPPHLGTNGQIFQVSNCPQLEWRDQIKQTRILKLEYQMRTDEWTPTRSGVEAARQGRGRLDYFFFGIFYCK